MELDEVDYEDEYDNQEGNEGNSKFLSTQDQNFVSELTDVTLFWECLPIIIIGVTMNLFSLWIWKSAKYGFQNVVFLFKALCLSDIIYLGFFFGARLWSFKNFQLKLIFKVCCYGQRTIGIYITLVLAIARFVKLYCPFRAQQILSPFRLKLMLFSIIVFSMSMQTFLSAINLFIPRSQYYHKYIKISLRRGPMTGLPGIAQNVLMGLVLCKMWVASKKIQLMNDSSSANEQTRKRNSSTEKIAFSSVHKTASKQGSEKDAPGVKPMIMNQQTPTSTVSNAGSQQQYVHKSGETPTHNEPTAVEKKLTVKPMIMNQQTPTSTVSNAGSPTSTVSNAGSQQQYVHISGETPTHNEPTAVEKKLTETTLIHCNEHSLQKTGRQPSREAIVAVTDNTVLTPGGERESDSNVNNDDNNATNNRRVLIPQAKEPHGSGSGSLMDQSERRVTLVVLAICLCTFMAFPFCSAVSFYQYITGNSTGFGNSCIYIALLNSCVNTIFYMFVDRFRKTLRKNLSELIENLLANSESSCSLPPVIMKELVEKKGHHR